MTLATVRDVKNVTLPTFPAEQSELVVMEGERLVPLRIARAFSIKVDVAGITRGRHAHRRCSQFMLCLNGAMSIRCDDGTATADIRLDKAENGLLVPPGIWVEVRSEAADSVLLVLCDRPYEAEDYVRDRAEFDAWRTKQ